MEVGKQIETIIQLAHWRDMSHYAESDVSDKVASMNDCADKI